MSDYMAQKANDTLGDNKKSGNTKTSNVPINSDMASAHTSAHTQDTHHWPPRRWPMFACITRLSGMAPCTARAARPNSFLSYEVTHDGHGIYTIEITSTYLDPQGGTHISPALGLSFCDKTSWMGGNLPDAVRALHARGNPLPINRTNLLNLILAITYTISRIERGAAPTLAHIQKTFHL